MTLVDTSVWVEHFRTGSARLARLLEEAQLLVHPFVAGELACGNLRNRARILADLSALPHSVSGTDEEVLRLLDQRKLWGQGIGWIDAHLLASALLSNCAFWTLDKKLNRIAATVGIRVLEA